VGGFGGSVAHARPAERRRPDQQDNGVGGLVAPEVVTNALVGSLSPNPTRSNDGGANKPSGAIGVT
jgi:hypothetical protein